MRIRYQFQSLLLVIAFVSASGLARVDAQAGTWVKSFGSALQDNPEDMLVDQAGNIYACGFFRDTMTIGSLVLEAAGKTDVFLAKFDSSGNVVWAKRFGWFANEFAHGLDFDRLGNVIMVGEYQDSTIFETDTIYSGDTLWYGAPALTYDVFWVRVTPEGVMEHVWAGGWFGSENFHEVSVGEDSLYYFAGMYRTFNPWTYASIYDVRGWGKGYDDAIWVRSDAAGTMDHKGIAMGRYVDRAKAIGLIGDSLVVMAGTFQDTCWFRDSTVYQVTDFEDNVFVACYGDTGDFRWTVQGGSRGIDEVNGLITDPQGNIYVVGTFDSALTIQSQDLVGSGSLDGYVARLDRNGDLLWMKKFGGDGYDAVKDIRLTDSGDLLVTGYFQKTMDLGGGVSLMLADTMDQGSFVARITDAGDPVWATSLGGSYPDVGIAVDEDAAGNIYAMGTFTGTGNFGQISITSTGGEDIYLLRMNADGAVFLTPATGVVHEVAVWPNPAASEFHLRYALRRSGSLALEIMDLNGRVLATLDYGRKEAGRGDVTVDCRELPGGIYLYRIRSSEGTAEGKIVLLR